MERLGFEGKTLRDLLHGGFTVWAGIGNRVGQSGGQEGLSAKKEENHQGIFFFLLPFSSPKRKGRPQNKLHKRNDNRLPFGLFSEKALAIVSLLRELMQQGVVIQVSREQEREGFYSHIYLVKKPSGKLCLILNLKILNKSIGYKRFWIDTIFSVKVCSLPICFMVSIELRDPYLHITII